MNGSSTEDLITTEANIVLAMLGFIIGISAVLLNSLLIYVIVRTKSLHTCTNTFILSLAIAELLVAIFAVSFAAVSRVPRDWAFSNTFCTVSGFLYNVGRSGAAYSLMFVCVDRCVAVSRPLKYSNIITRGTSVVFTSIAWGLSVLIAAGPFFGRGMYGFVLRYSLCMLQGDSNSAHMLIKEIFGCMVPAFVILVVLLKIIWESKYHHRVFAAMPIPANLDNPRVTNHGRSTLKAMKALFAITLSYASLCFPLSVVKILDQMRYQGLPETTVTPFVWLSFLCCAINPVVIATMNRKFKQSFVTIICACLKKSGNQDPEAEGFTITSGLHTVLDASLLVNVNNDSSFRRSKLLKARTNQDVSASLAESKTLRRINSIS